MADQRGASSGAAAVRHERQPAAEWRRAAPHGGGVHLQLKQHGEQEVVGD